MFNERRKRVQKYQKFKK